MKQPMARRSRIYPDSRPSDEAIHLRRWVSAKGRPETARIFQVRITKFENDQEETL